MSGVEQPLNEIARALVADQDGVDFGNGLVEVDADGLALADQGRGVGDSERYSLQPPQQGVYRA